jgi:putative ABC transport system permease protein
MTATATEDAGPGRDPWAIALGLARRELRGRARGFRIFLSCLALGVATIAGVGSLSAAFTAGLADNARSLLGGDLEIRVPAYGATVEQVAWMRDHSPSFAVVRELRAMAYADSGARTLVELKGVEGGYPLYGTVTLEPPGALGEVLAKRDGLAGAAVEPTLLQRLDLRLGDTVRIGDHRVAIRAVILREPDRVAGAFTLGPRILVDTQTFDATGLVQPGSMLRHRYRIGLEGADASTWIADLDRAFPDAPWRIYGLDDAQPSVKRFIDRLGIFLTLVGLTALVIGGVGIGNAVHTFLESRRQTIAILKCLGASSAMVFRVYFLAVGTFAVLGIAIGTAVGAVVPAIVGAAGGAALPIPPDTTVHPAPLMLAAAFGVLTTTVFALWPLARARDIPAAELFRDIVTTGGHRPAARFLGLSAAAIVALVALALASSAYLPFARWFVAGAAVAIFAFWMLGRAVVAIVSRLPRPSRPALRLALANIGRPNAPTAGVMMSMGLGLTVLIAVAQLDANLTRQVHERIPERAPAFFFIDIQPAQVEGFEETVRAIDGGEVLQRMPNLRGRLARIAGVPVEEATYDRRAGWFVDGERGLTYASDPPAGADVVAGDWWPADYAGPPLISLDAHVAAELGVRIGDTLTFNVLGRQITARIANLRAIDWGRLQVEFATVFAPGVLEGAPQTHVAAVGVPPANEDALHRAVTDRYANVTAVRIRDVLATVTDIMQRIIVAVRGSAGLSVAAGILVLAGAVAAGYRRRLYDAVLLKVLGATRADVARTFLIEYAVLGAITAGLAGAIGTVAAWAVMQFVMDGDFVIAWTALLSTGIMGVMATLAVGIAGTWRALGEKSMDVLRTA